MWPQLFDNSLICVRCLRHLQLRQFHIFNRHFSSVTKILSDVQKVKLNNNCSKRKSISEPTSRRLSKLPKPPKHTKFTLIKQVVNATEINDGTITNSFDEVASLNVANLQSEVSQISFDNSIDIFKELGIETYTCENLQDKDFMSSSIINNNEDVDIFDDTQLTKKNLLSYIHVCIYNDSLSEAHSFLLEFIGKFSNSLSSSDIAHCCELLIKGWARKGNTENVLELKEFISKSLKVTLNHQIYEYYLLSLAKQMKETTAEDVKALLDEMRQFNLTPEHLFYRSTLNKGEIKFIHDFLDKLGISLRLRKFIHSKAYHNKHIEEILRTGQKDYDPFQGIDLSQMNAFVEAQFNSEKECVVKVAPIDARFYDLEAKKPQNYYEKLINILESEWRVTLTEGFQNYLSLIRSKHKRLNGIPFVHYMTILEPAVYVEAMMEEIRKCASFSEYYSPFASQLFQSLGSKIMTQYLLRSNTNEGTLEDFYQCYQQYVQYTLQPDLIKRYNPREYWQHLLESDHHYYFDETKSWPNNVLKEIGKDLYEIISTDAKFNSLFMQLVRPDFSALQPVITFLYKNHDTVKTKRELRVHPLLIKLYEGACSHIHFESERLPMLSPPVPWINPNFGGNLLIQNFIVRPPPLYPKQKLKKLPLHQMYPTYDSLNALSLCPWKINGNILDIAIGIFKNKGNTDLDIPVSLSSFGPLPKASSEMSPKEKAYIYHQRKMQKKEQAEMYSLWVDCLYKLSIGNFLRDRIFWFPINTDFRSRVYPIPPNFNHLGSDLSRALLLFAKGAPLEEQGLKWLKVHLINLTGFKKRSSTEERLAYADEVIDLIMDSADNPLTGQKWWMESDEKWQTLACCIELTNAIRSGDPARYISHIPVHQDGSCNGLQHYAALGRDAMGAKSVNLMPMSHPQDVYSDVAALVDADIQRDMENGLEIAQVVRGFITRKIVKQTVMTYVYGVTKYGAKLQVLKRLKEDSKFPEAHKVTASLYISEKIFLSIRKMFTQTRVIQDWLTNCAQIISTDYNSTVEWVTPLGFPVVQSYYKSLKQKNSLIRLIPNTMKQKNAFPANFIHSLDSTHMMLTSLECHRHGLTFASVHDCYWTHASKIDQMNYYCRKSFLKMHSEPILDNLAVHLKDQLDQINHNRPVPNHDQLAKLVNQRISKGVFDLNTIMNSVYFFS